MGASVSISEISLRDIRSSGSSDVGLLRSENQDSIYLNQEEGLYLIFDGMGGHQGGATAARVAQETFVELISRGRAKSGGSAPAKLLSKACKAASAEVHRQAKAHRELHGMGTTVVSLLMPRPGQAFIAHVGDSRAYLFRKERLRRLTADHTVVAELVTAGKLTPEQAFYHPHSSVLSRNLGGLPTTDVDLLEVPLRFGDRLLLCSDGLNGYATRSAIEQVLSGAEDPDAATADLIDLAKRGGGGDNISAIVIDIAKSGSSENISASQSGADHWWSRREIFMATCQRLGLAKSPLADQLVPEEALDLLAGSFCEAVYHDLLKTTRVHVWTYADSIISGWMKREGNYAPVELLFDTLRSAALSVVEDVSRSHPALAVALEISLLRALIVGEMVLGGQLSEDIQEASQALASASTTVDLPEATFASVVTVPFACNHSPEPAEPEVSQCLFEASKQASRDLGADLRPQLKAILDATHASASDLSGVANMSAIACEIYGPRLLTELEITPVFGRLDAVRAAHLAATEAQQVPPATRAAALCALALAHQSLYHALALVIVDAGKPTTDSLLEMRASTTAMRNQLSRNEAQISQLEGEMDTLEDLPT